MYYLDKFLMLLNVAIKRKALHFQKTFLEENPAIVKNIMIKSTNEACEALSIVL